MRGRSASPAETSKKPLVTKQGLFKKLIPRGAKTRDSTSDAYTSGTRASTSLGPPTGRRTRASTRPSTGMRPSTVLTPIRSSVPENKVRSKSGKASQSPTSVLPDGPSGSTNSYTKTVTKPIIQTAKKVHNESERDGFCRRVDFYDGQTISVDGKPTYEVGNYLGGGVAGVVYEGNRLRPLDEYPIRAGYADQGGGSFNDLMLNSLKLDDSVEEPNMNGGCNDGWWASASVEDQGGTQKSNSKLNVENKLEREDSNILSEKDETVAIKILNPVGFRLLSSSSCATATIVKEGVPMDAEVLDGSKPMLEEHVWWLVNPSSKNLRTLKREPSPLVVDRRDGAAVGTTFAENSRSKRVSSDAVVRTDLLDRGSDDKGLRLSLIAAYVEPTSGTLKELPLTRCIEIWGHAPFGASEIEFEEMMDAIERVNAGLPSREECPDETENEDSLTEVEPFPFMKNSGLYRASNSKKSNLYCEALNAHIAVSKVPPKYIRWLRQRRAATKEIRNMMRIGRHKNVVHLYEVMELIQESKSIMFLVLELVRGGELFDLISSNSANTMCNSSSAELSEAEQVEIIMRKFFNELSSGISYCHANGIAHRDLKPENLLVHNDSANSRTLKIADFGLSSTFTLTKKPVQYDRQESSCTPMKGCDPPSPGPVTGLSPLLNRNFNSMLSLLTCGSVDQIAECFVMPTHLNVPGEAKSLKRMTSIVGSPHYVAPEIISQTDGGRESGSCSQAVGYDGTKADVWSAGVILYAMLFRSLPFGEDLLRCPRFQSFSKWYGESRKMGRTRRLSAEAALEPLEENEPDDLGPQWFFPSQTSLLSKDLIVAMLNPNPSRRLAIEQVLDHPWMTYDFTA